MAQRTRSRKGNYSVMTAMALVALLSFGALAVDVSYTRYAQGQCQDVADAASQAAVMILRRTGDPDQARQAAEHVVAANSVAGGKATVDDFQFGIWNDTEEPATFTPTHINPNATYVAVGRTGSNAVPTLIGDMFGWARTDITSSSISATRSLQIILVMDITGSWRQKNFKYAREAAQSFLEVMKSSYSDWDQVGMTVFTNRFGWEYSPLTFIADDTGGLASQWSLLNVASKAGRDTDPNDDGECSKNGGSAINDFSSPVVGGCYPAMPREYRDEPGTDHTTGMEMARTMFQESNMPTAYKAMVVLTDGQPNGLGSAGTARADDGYTETRWREYAGPTPHNGTDIRADSINLTQELWETQRVHSWVVSFVTDDAFMHEMPRGDGYYQKTTSSSALVDIFEDIAHSMPIAIVE